MDDLKAARITVSLHTVVGILVGYLSIQIVQMSRTLFAVFAGLVLLLVIGYLSEKIVGKKGVKFWIVNGVIAYLFIWLITWIFLFNLL